MAQRDYTDLLELLLHIREGVAEAFPGRYWVKAEIASWSPRANGHCYLSLSQSRGGKPIAECRAMIWKWQYPQLKAFFEQQTGQTLGVGLTVLVRVQVNFSELFGISLFIDDIDPAFTLGEQALERKRAIERLTAGGYMDLQKELALPDVPRRLAVITSATAAGYGDFCKHLLHSPEGYAFEVTLYEALMQGEQAPASILEALDAASSGAYDAVLLLRGGGSELDLACFDDYELALGIATCPLPVCTAIGHERDVHIADMVANISVKTPTALADLFLNAFREQDALLDSLDQRTGTAALRRITQADLRLRDTDLRIQRAVQARFGALLRQVDGLENRVRLGLHRLREQGDQRLQRCQGRIAKGLLHKLLAVERLADAAAHRVRFGASARLSQELSGLALREARIGATDPRNILSLGYVLVTGRDNKVLKTVERVSVGDRIGVRFRDGSLTAKVDEVFAEDRSSSATA